MSDLNLPQHTLHHAGQQNAWVSRSWFWYCHLSLAVKQSWYNQAAWQNAGKINVWKMVRCLDAAVMKVMWVCEASRLGFQNHGGNCWKPETPLFLYYWGTSENTSEWSKEKQILWWSKETLVLQLLLWNFSGKKGVGAVLAGLWLACTEEFSPISVVSCCRLQSLTLPVSIQPLLLRSSFTHGLDELLVAHAAQKSDAC